MIAGTDVSIFHNYGDSLVAGGGYAFVSYVGTNSHYYVNRIDLSTMLSDGLVDMGPRPINDGHLYASLAIDPTDNRVVWCRSGRHEGGVEAPTAIRKTANAYGGTQAQWAANDFGTLVLLPYPSQTGLVSYAHMVILADGTLLILGSGRYSAENPTIQTGVQNAYLYRYLGDGTSKTATQMATGSWTELVHKVPEFDGQTAHAIYISRMVYESGRLAVTYHYYEQYNTSPTDANAGGTSRRRGMAYIYTTNPTAATPTWRTVDGSAISVPVVNDATARASSLYAYDTYGDYLGSVTHLADGTPFLASEKWTLSAAPDYNLTSATVVGYTWSGSSWIEHQVSSGEYAGNHHRTLYNGGKPLVVCLTDTLDLSSDTPLERREELQLGNPQFQATGGGMIYAGKDGKIGTNLILGQFVLLDTHDLDVFLSELSALRRRQRITIGGV